MLKGQIVSECELKTIFFPKKDDAVATSPHQASPTDSFIYVMGLAKKSGLCDITLAAGE